MSAERLPSPEAWENAAEILAEAGVSPAEAAEDPVFGAFATFFTRQEQAKIDESQGEQ